MSLREASLKYGIPKSTLYDHYSGKVTKAEEGMLEEWAISMSKIGYGCTREQVIEIVKDNTFFFFLNT